MQRYPGLKRIGRITFLTVSLLWCLSPTVRAATRYVDLNSPAPESPYTNWVTAATNIQDAVDAAVNGDLIWVTNGVYASGSQPGQGSSNRLLLTKSVTVQSVNGPDVTIIAGYQVPGTTNGPEAIRCVQMGGSSILSGFTLTNGATYVSYDGGGVYASVSGPLMTNCVIAGNSAARNGGGVFGRCTLNNCTLIGNSAVNGGGAYAALRYSVWLDNSRVLSNSAQLGGGLYNVDAHGSYITGNSADAGGGAWAGRVVNCTVVHNSATIGGGTYQATNVNSILYFNNADAAVANYSGGTFGNCCTTPLPGGGADNTSADPQLASASHLSASSPCRGAGDDRYAVLTDIDGEAWQHPPSIGCDEYNVGAVTGALSVAISAAYTNVAAGFGVEFASLIEGRTSASVWQFGDGTTVSNRPYAGHAWNAPGDYIVTLTAYNESYPEGVEASLTVHVQTVLTHFVMLGSTNPVAPYTNWDTASGDIQSAIDAADLPGAAVIVADGVYDTGGRAVDGLMTNRVAVDKPLTLMSLNGPAVTWIVGYQLPGTPTGDGAIRCVYLADGAMLSGFTLTNGATRRDGDLEHEQKGGAVWCPSLSGVVTNCVLTHNAAYQRAGGAYRGTLTHCTLRNNSAVWSAGSYGSVLTECVLTSNSAGTYGGGVGYGLLNNCTVAGNSAQYAGGAWASALDNCIVYYNTAREDCYSCRLNNCCTTPLPAGVGNFTNAPLFVDTNGWANLRLETNSLCINAGNNASVLTTTDLDGNPRIVSGTVDMGAYEYQGPGSVISYAWLQQYGLPIDGSADNLDSDLDGHNAWQEWKAWTDPTNALSVLKLLTPQPDTNRTVVTWQSVLGHGYFVERTTNAGGSFSSLRDNISGLDGTTSVSDTNPPTGPAFYRVGVQP